MIPLVQMLRDRGLSNRIGFFLHIPWPPTRLLVSLPHHRALVESLFAYDVIGFQTEEWLESFRHYVDKEMGGTVDGDDCTVGSRTIKAIANPIGIDFEDFCAAGSSPEADQMRRQMSASLQASSLIVGAARLDHSKGTEAHSLGIERLTKSYSRTIRTHI